MLWRSPPAPTASPTGSVTVVDEIGAAACCPAAVVANAPAAAIASTAHTAPGRGRKLVARIFIDAGVNHVGRIRQRPQRRRGPGGAASSEAEREGFEPS